MKKEYKTFDCNYMRKAKDPRYLYIHVGIDYGWGHSGGMYMFLYDTSTHELRCSLDNREIVDFRNGVVEESYLELDSQIVDDDVRIEEMFSTNEMPSKWYDAGSYSIFLMSGERIKYFGIDSPEISSYPSFLWIIEHAEWVRKTDIIKRYGVEQRRLIRNKYCHCLIPYHFTGGDKCVQYERKFHNFPSAYKDENIVSLSIMTYIKLYSLTDSCFHITIHLDSKQCSCIKVSEDNVESVFELSESLTDLLTRQGNIDELLRGKWIKEIENCIYDGNHYYYIIQQGNKFNRYFVATSFVKYWPLFERISNELYPFMEPKMMY